MKQTDLIKRVTEEMKALDYNTTQDLTKTLLTVTEEVIDEVILAEDSVVVLGTKFYQKEVKGRNGVAQFGDGEGKEYSTPDKKVPAAKVTDAKRKKMAIEI